MSESISRRLSEALNKNCASFGKLEHDRWSHWQSYLHSQCEQLGDGSLKIPADLVRRWQRQIETDYTQLTSEEQQSDLEQVQPFLDLVKRIAKEELE